ncbi:MAG: hypothetical protein ACRC10_03235, partial [Thermoguttaceae bacterium]
GCDEPVADDFPSELVVRAKRFPRLNQVVRFRRHCNCQKGSIIAKLRDYILPCQNKFGKTVFARLTVGYL